MENKYTCHSGGCSGADIEWEKECDKYGISTISYSFRSHIQEGKNRLVLNEHELSEGWERILHASKQINRNHLVHQHKTYIRGLLSRNWHQVKNSDAVYAVSSLTQPNHRHVKGGTGWAVQMAIDVRKPTYLFEQRLNGWYKFDYMSLRFEPMNCIPKLEYNFAGIGTREINELGINAIKEILKYNLDGK